MLLIYEKDHNNFYAPVVKYLAPVHKNEFGKGGWLSSYKYNNEFVHLHYIFAGLGFY